MSDNIYSLLAIDAEVTEDGAWMKLTKDIAFKIRRFNAKKSRKTRERLESPYARILKSGAKLEEDTADDINLRHLAEGIIADWTGVTDKEGNAVQYSVEAAVKLLTDLPELQSMIAAFSLDMTNYKAEQDEEIEGN